MPCLRLCCRSDISAEPGVVRCSLPVSESVQNRYGTLHGGCIATLVDVVTTAALVTVSDFSGVTLELSAAYLNPCAAGDVAEVEARVLKAGGAVAVLSCVVKARGTGRAVANGRHTKYLPRTAVAPQLQAMLKAQQGRTAGADTAAAFINSKL
jgi:acyl-coenzyme A thioesterase 13